MMSNSGASGQSSTSSASRILDPLPVSWSELQSQVLATPHGSTLEADRKLRESGLGPAHSDNDIRTFEKMSASNVASGESIVFYKDRASWCPYCQKVWMLLEEKQIPYKVSSLSLSLSLYLYK